MLTHKRSNIIAETTSNSTPRSSDKKAQFPTHPSPPHETEPKSPTNEIDHLWKQFIHHKPRHKSNKHNQRNDQIEHKRNPLLTIWNLLTNSVTQTKLGHKPTDSTHEQMRTNSPKENQTHTCTTTNKQITSSQNLPSQNRSTKPSITTMPLVQRTKSWHKSPLHLHLTTNTPHRNRPLKWPCGSG